jgi:hypothetical protein
MGSIEVLADPPGRNMPKILREDVTIACVQMMAGRTISLNPYRSEGKKILIMIQVRTSPKT